VFSFFAVERQKVWIALVCCLIGTTAARASGQEFSWPQFHGPNRDNISAEEGLLKEWPKGGPELLWTAEGLGHGFSSVSVARGMICTTGSIGEDTVVTALDLNGNPLWRTKNGGAWTGDRPGTRGTPTFDGDRVYHQSPLGNIVCLEADTGKVVWSVNILEKFESEPPTWALAESLLIDGDHLISCPGGPQTSMVALDKKTGSVVWKAPSTNELAGYASPILVEYEGRRIIMTLTLKGLIGVDADSGELLWHVKHESYADENVLVPIFRDGFVFISTLQAGSVKWKINVENDKVWLEEVWRTEELDNHHGGVLLLGDNLYGTSTFKNRNQWVCLDWGAGEVKQVEKGVGKGSLTYADGMLYTLNIDRIMGLARPIPDGLELVSSFEIPEGGKGNSWAHPVVCGGRLYIRHGDFLYVYNIR
jgi:outer membrane protein assembly factor BamB